MKDLETRQRAREWFHGLTALPGAWIVIRVDGRGFSRFTEDRFDKPFDARFSELMTGTAQALLTEFDGRYAYTESDEISVLLDPSFALFGRSVEKLVSLSAATASSAFTHAAGTPVQFDSRLWLGNDTTDVLDYFTWRQADAARCALNGWCYWTMRKHGKTRGEATKALERTTIADKNELLHGYGVNFNEVPAWQRRGVGITWETYERPGFDPVREVAVTATRRRVRVDRDLPMKDAYRDHVRRML